MNARNVLPPKSALTENPATKAQEAREAAEQARERHWRAPSFVRELFEGSFRLDLVYPFPEIDAAEAARARPFLDRLERFLREEVDSDRIDREAKIPSEVIQGLKALGALGIKIPTNTVAWV
jgi:alkylation response protein AidB-like acyl-CoA dehydrogenase